MPSNELRLRLMPGKVLLRLDPKEDHIGTLFVPDTAQRVSDLATCVLHEPSSAWQDIELTGHRVCYERWSGKEVEILNTTYYMVEEKNIHGYEEREGDSDDRTGAAGQAEDGNRE